MNGITTNPTLLKKAGAKSWGNAKEIMKDLCSKLRPYPVSLELTELEEEKMVKQASELAELGDNSVIKVPVGGYTAVNPSADPFTGLKVIRRLWEKGRQDQYHPHLQHHPGLSGPPKPAPPMSAPSWDAWRTTPTRTTSPSATPGNSLYWVEDHKNAKGDQVMHNSEYVASGGSVKDAGARLIFEIATVFANYRITTEILAASFRNQVQLTECLLAGADILTVPANVLMTVANHPLSDEGMKSFVEDSKAFGM